MIDTRDQCFSEQFYRQQRECAEESHRELLFFPEIDLVGLCKNDNNGYC